MLRRARLSRPRKTLQQAAAKLRLESTRKQGGSSGKHLQNEIPERPGTSLELSRQRITTINTS